MISMARPSRALRPSATTTRYAGCLCAPMRVNRMRTAMGAVLPPGVLPAGRSPGRRWAGLLDGQTGVLLIDLRADLDGPHERVEWLEERLDGLLVLGPLFGRGLVEEALGHGAHGGGVDERDRGVDR